jgi:hypothetical protein
MTDQEAAEMIRQKCMTGDYESDHGDADDILVSILVSLGYEQTAEAYDAVGKWYA